MIKQLLNSAIAKYRDLSVARRSMICLCLRHRQIIDLLATDKSRYFAQPRPIIVCYYIGHHITLVIILYFHKAKQVYYIIYVGRELCFGQIHQ